jgi:hypothetical protein
MTILFNQQTEQIIYRFYNQYTIDGVGQPLGELEPGIWHLQIVDTEQPNTLPTQKASSNYVPYYSENLYVLEWTIIDKTPIEIQREDWDSLEHAIRIIAPIQLIMDDIGIKMYGWFTLNNLPVIPKDNGTVRLYCNEILPEHQAIIDSLQGVITIEERP